MKYILRESELRYILNGIINEELNEGLGHALGSALGNTVKNAALGAVAPGLLAGKFVNKTNNIANGKDSMVDTVKNFFGAENGSSTNGSLRKNRAERQREKLAAKRDVSYEYGRPETVPCFGNREKLAGKRDISEPGWGSFGNHYHDEGDRMWNRKFKNEKEAFERNVASGSLGVGGEEKLKRRYKKRLEGWLKDRDEAYKIYIKGIK